MTIAAECAQECAYGVCSAPRSYQGCGGCCGCLGPCVVAYENSLRDPAGLASEVDASALGSAEDSRSSGSLGTSRPRTAAHKPATREQQ